MKNKKGQQIMIGIMILVMAVIIFVSTIPALSTLFNGARGCQYLNCAGWIDMDSSTASCSSTNTTYISSLREDSFACTILDLGIPYLILGVLIGLVSKLLHGKLVEPEYPQMYPQGY